jgi:acyl-CoA thioester hydrolase
MSIPAPFDRYRGEVLSEWIDANDHMNLAYYTVLFDYATDALFDAVGIGRHYKDSTGNGTFVVETHNLYERELLLGDRVRVSTQILGMDVKRLHLAHEMFGVANRQRAATQELMYLHVDLSTRRVVPFPDEVRERVAAAAAMHAHLPLPDWAGRRLAMLALSTPHSAASRASSIKVAVAGSSSKSAIASVSGKISTLRSFLSIARRRTPAASTTC